MKKTTENTMITIPEGVFLMGEQKEVGFIADRERPQVMVSMPPFLMDETTVTVSEFKSFVDETGYTTDAEKIGFSFVFHLLLPPEQRKDYQIVPQTSWWLIVEGANWKHPEGPDSTVDYRINHPVTHVSRNDALAYCKWSGKRLPTEAEWEYAARGGMENEIYPWGSELKKDKKYQCNIWQGDFPTTNTVEDGYLSTAPVFKYEPNGYGLFQMSGNVWEWCLNPARIPLKEFQFNFSMEFYEQNKHWSSNNYALKGGSFLCHDSYCNRYRVAARNGNSGDTSASNIGFRCVQDISKFI